MPELLFEEGTKVIDKLIRANIKNLAVYRPGKPIEEVQRELGLDRVIKLASNENPLGASPRAIDAITRAAGGVALYPDSNAHHLTHALAGKLKVDPKMIILGNGSSEIIQMLSLALLNPGDEVLIAVPSFPRYEPLARLMNAVPVEVGLTDFTVDLETMARRLSPQTKLVYLCNPNNPTGTINTRAELDSFMAQVPPHVLVVLDEAYYEFVTDKEYPNGLEYLRAGHNVIVMRTFSKVYGLAALRIGYGVAQPELVTFLHRVREPFNVNSLAQEAALAALDDHEFEQRTLENNRIGKEQIYQGLQELGLKFIPTEANFILFDASRDEQDVFRRLLQKGVIIRGGYGYRTMMRVSIGTPAENNAFLSALKTVLREDA